MKIRVILLSIICVGVVCVFPILKYENDIAPPTQNAVVLSLGHVSKLKGAAGFLSKRAIEFQIENPTIFVIVKSVSEQQIENSDNYDIVSYLQIDRLITQLFPYAGRVNINSQYIAGGSNGNQIYGVAWCKVGADVQYFGIINSKKYLYSTAFIEFVTSDKSQGKLPQVKLEGVL